MLTLVMVLGMAACGGNTATAEPAAAPEQSAAPAVHSSGRNWIYYP